MKPAYFILLPDGSREGPYTEEDLLDLMDSDEIPADTLCEEEGTGRQCAAGDLFAVIEPMDMLRDDPPPLHTPLLPLERTPEPRFDPDDFPQVIRPSVRPADDVSLRDRSEKQETRPAAAPGPPRVLYRGRPSVLNYWRSLAFAAVLVSAGWYAGRLDGGWVIGGLAAGTLLLIGIVVRRSATEYLVSTRRIEVREGLISESSREMRVQDIRSINVHKPGFLGLLGVGTVEFASAGTEGKDLRFNGIRRAVAVKNLVRKLQDRGA